MCTLGLRRWPQLTGMPDLALIGNTTQGCIPSYLASSLTNPETSAICEEGKYADQKVQGTYMPFTTFDNREKFRQMREEHFCYMKVLACVKQNDSGWSAYFMLDIEGNSVSALLLLWSLCRILRFEVNLMEQKRYSRVADL